MKTEVSAFVLDLYRASRRMPHAELRPWVFDALSRLVQFDSAFWYRWTINAEISPIHAWYLWNQPESLLEEYSAGQLWEDDVVYHRAVAAEPCTAIYASYDDYTSPRMRAFLKRHRQEQVLTIALRQEVPQVAAGMSLYRNETRQPYSNEDAEIIEAVTPHVIDAWRENWLHELVQKHHTNAQLPEFSLGLLTANLMMSEAQDNFGQLMHFEWPTWQGPWLPEPLASHVQASADPYFGSTITVYQREESDRSRLLLLRRCHRFDQLAPRKRAVALMFAHGSSQTEVASKLFLSPSTVNNYLGAIYQDLDVSDKIGLAQIVRRLEP